MPVPPPPLGVHCQGCRARSSRNADSRLVVWVWRAETIMFPEAPLALRLSGQLVLGVVRVYYRQLEFLDDDAAAAFTKLLKVQPPPILLLLLYTNTGITSRYQNLTRDIVHSE